MLRQQTVSSGGAGHALSLSADRQDAGPTAGFENAAKAGYRIIFMNGAITILMVLAAVPGQAAAQATTSRPSASRPADLIACFRLRSPDDKHDLEQGSDLHFGKLGDREGLWIACDRNGGPSAGKVYFVSASTPERAQPMAAIKTDDCFTVVPPAEGLIFQNPPRACARPTDCLHNRLHRLTAIHASRWHLLIIRLGVIEKACRLQVMPATSLVNRW